jgi:tRNA nucleotidyltransferase (CCA-adding enzyme)
MSPSRIITSPEGNKRRKLSTSPAPRLIPKKAKMGPMMIQEVEDEAGPPKTLELTEVEQTLRRLLLDVASYVDQLPWTAGQDQVALPDKLAKEPIILRFTGGWVRDKLLGVPSHDIDVAINKMTGLQFGMRLKEYLEIPGNPEKYGLEGVATTEKQSAKAGTTDKSKTVGGLHKIEANPEKSKHLETVTTKILGLDIDLVNLRKETYSDDSRNPQMEFGTPEEDAMRRDATVNALFYNINTEQIEDFTNQGFDDMAKRIIRTPLEPYQTFKDDPLRVLRLIRFASRLNYTIESESLKAMSDPDIKDALRKKISRERVGVELEKALRGPDPHDAMRLVFDLGLYFTIFSDPTVEDLKHYQPDTKGTMGLIDELKSLLDGDSDLPELLARDADERYMAWLLTAIVPYRDAPQPEAQEAGRKALPPIPTGVTREGIKATNKICDIVTSSVRNLNEIARLVDGVDTQKRRAQKTPGSQDLAARDTLGMAVRRWGPTWRSQVMYALLVELVEHRDNVDGKSAPCKVNSRLCANEMTAIERKYATFTTHLRDLDILDAYTLKPLLDGKALAKALATPPGPWMKDALDVVMAWQLRNPHVKDPSEAIEEVKKHGELTSALASHFLKLTIRPLFVKAKPDNVTEQGRKKGKPELPAKMTSEDSDERVTKPWKSEKDRFALALLKWIVNSLEEKSTEQVWPLLVPPILTLVDDWETQYKQLGAELLHSLLRATSPTLLSRTGLGSVFEDALMPCLTYLPSLTPENDSVAILAATYPALFTLIETRFPTTTSTPPKDPTRLNRIKSLDTILRKGILHTYAHCGQYPNITRVLFLNLTTLLNELGIDSVKHLQYILPMLSESLTQAAKAQQTDLLMATLQALQAAIFNGWPRMVEHRIEIMKGVTIAWLILVESGKGDTGEVAEVKKCMIETVRVLHAAMGEKESFFAECRQLLEADETLVGLLGWTKTT